MTDLDLPLRPASAAPPAPWPNRLWQRELSHYPALATRALSLAIVVLVTVLFYYQYYVISVSTALLRETGMSFVFFVGVNVVSVVASAVASLAAGVTDRYGRANVIVWGTLGCALVCIFGLGNAHTSASVAAWYAVLGALEGVVLVATPALVRDFSPQVGRATAMGFWTLGPVLGSLAATVVVSSTSDHLDAWQDQYVIAGLVGVGVFVLALLGLRELSPELRDQVLVSEKDPFGQLIVVSSCVARVSTTYSVARPVADSASISSGDTTTMPSNSNPLVSRPVSTTTRSSPDGGNEESCAAARAPGASSASSGQDASQALTSARRAAGTTMPTVPATSRAIPTTASRVADSRSATPVISVGTTPVRRTASGRSASRPTRSAYAAAKS